MKRAAKLGGNAMAAIIGQKLVEGATSLAHAMKYCRAAQTEEKNGFAFTASVEWQKAAESLAPFPSLADYCWQQWERIMRLPRRLANPIAETQVTNTQGSDLSAEQFHAVRQAGHSESEIAENIAHIAEKFFIENLYEVDQNEVDLPIIAAAQSMAAAA
jgi:hypothetical protein